MITTEKIIIKRRGLKNIDHYNNLGYDTSQDDILISITHLSKGSKKVIDASCDICNKQASINYRDYNKYNIYPYYICKSCKRKSTNLEKYGVENVFQCERIKDRIKDTNLERYGFEYVTKSDEIKNKIKDTNLERYGVENVFQSERIKKRIISNNIDKYGYEYYSQTDECKLKVKDTFMNRYGGFTLESTSLMEKVKSTNLEKYGTESPSKLPEIKNKTKKTFNEKYGGFTLDSEELVKKVKKTNLERYGFEYYQSTDDYKNDIIVTNLNRYGKEYYQQTEEYKQKCLETNLRKYNTKHPSMNEKFRKENFAISNDTNYIKYLNNGISLFNCDRNHEFKIHGKHFHDRKGHNITLCTICYPINEQISIKEKELLKYVESVYDGKILKSYRDGLEIDVYLPELNIGFEFNGLYWHSNMYKKNNYHLEKTNHFKSKDIHIIHIWEDDWVYKNDIIKSQISNWVGKTKNKIYARSCRVAEIHNPQIIKEFMGNNHIQGSANSVVKLGLYYEDDLVSVMTFDHFEGRKKMNNMSWNLNRFCNRINTTITGGSSKLLKFFIKNYKPDRIISYADKCWSEGKIYDTIGFTKVNESNIDYKYIVNSKRHHKSNYKKSITGVSESELIIPKIYDCGKIKYEYKNDKYFRSRTNI